MKGMPQIVHIFPFPTFFRSFRWLPRVIVNIFLVYFSINAIIRKIVDGYTAVVQTNGKFCLKTTKRTISQLR